MDDKLTTKTAKFTSLEICTYKVTYKVHYEKLMRCLLFRQLCLAQGLLQVGCAYAMVYKIWATTNLSQYRREISIIHYSHYFNGKLLKFLDGHFFVKRLIFIGSKYLRKVPMHILTYQIHSLHDKTDSYVLWQKSS